MKKFKLLMAVALVAFVSLSLVSCDPIFNDDEDITYSLEGTWEGDMYISSMLDGVTYDATYSEISFMQDPYKYSSGTGYWIDYYDNAGWSYQYDYVANHIEWQVRNGVIQIYFVEDNYYMDISDYSIRGDHFYGTIIDGDNIVDFDLIHTSSPNWGDYYYGSDPYYGYAKPQFGADSAKQSTERPKRFVRKR